MPDTTNSPATSSGRSRNRSRDTCSLPKHTDVYTFVPPSKGLREWAAEVKRDYSGVENIANFAQAREQGLFSATELKEIATLIPRFYNAKLRSCFPYDAFQYLQALFLIADHITPRANIDLDKERKALLRNIGMTEDAPQVTTLDAFDHFRHIPAKQFPDYEALVKKFSQHIDESLRRSYNHKDPILLRQVVSIFKVLAYLHKCIRSKQYECPCEYDEMTTWGVSEIPFSLVRLRRDQISEPSKAASFEHLTEKYTRVGIKANRFEQRIPFDAFFGVDVTASSVNPLTTGNLIARAR